MYPLIFIAKNNIKKHKGEVAILFALIFLSAVLMFSSARKNTIRQTFMYASTI